MKHTDSQSPITRALEAIQSLPRGASFNRGKSKQDYSTPKNFRDAVVAKFGFPTFDLAANAHNFFAPSDSEYFGVAANSLIEDWSSLRGLLWLNCPFGNIEPWAAKCREESKKGARILFLVPASVGSNWFSLHVHTHAFVHFLNPRLSFDGKNSFPKDCMLAEYGIPIIGYDVWRWK